MTEMCDYVTDIGVTAQPLYLLSHRQESRATAAVVFNTSLFNCLIHRSSHTTTVSGLVWAAHSLALSLFCLDLNSLKRESDVPTEDKSISNLWQAHPTWRKPLRNLTGSPWDIHFLFCRALLFPADIAQKNTWTTLSTISLSPLRLPPLITTPFKAVLLSRCTTRHTHRSTSRPQAPPPPPANDRKKRKRRRKTSRANSILINTIVLSLPPVLSASITLHSLLQLEHSH